MSFVPPCCPHAECPSRAKGAKPSFCKRGRYVRKCDGRVVQRFACHHCGRRFSTQSFRVDKGLRKTWLCAMVVEMLNAKMSMRRAAEILRVRRPTVERRLDSYGAHAQQLHRAILDRYVRKGGAVGADMVLDELETFVNDRTICPVTVPVLAEPVSYFITHVDTAPMASRGGLTKANEARKQRYEKKHGVRPHESDAAVTRTLESWKRLCAEEHEPSLTSDEKPSYARLFEKVFEGRGRHVTVSSKIKRDEANPLFVVNMTNAMLRDGLGRLVRRTWGHSRDEGRLRRHLWLWVVFRNYVRDLTRRIRNTTPARKLGVVDRRFKLNQVLAWRAPFVELLFAGRP